MEFDLHNSLTEEQTNALINSVAEKVHERKLESIAILFLEMNKPLSFLASQALLVAMPFFGPLIGADKMADFSKLLSKRENIELLISRIEDIAVENDENHNPQAAEG